MTDELKTLKHIGLKRGITMRDHELKQEIREEAIKHAKKLNDSVMLCIKYEDNEGAKMCLSQLKWIEDFFNISDEEIK